MAKRCIVSGYIQITLAFPDLVPVAVDADQCPFCGGSMARRSKIGATGLFNYVCVNGHGWQNNGKKTANDSSR